LGCSLCMTIGFCAGNIREPITWKWWGEVLTFAALAVLALVGLVVFVREIHKIRYYPWEKGQ
jgi:membrane protein implicated in regulation of membrane protease activity